MKTINITNLKARLRNLTFNLAKPILRGFIQGSAIAIGFLTTALLAVAVTGNIKTWTAGETLTSSDLNTTIGSLQAAIVGIPNWAKAANGNDAVYTAGNVGIGTSSPAGTLHMSGSNPTIFLQQNSDGTSRRLIGLDGSSNLAIYANVGQVIQFFDRDNTTERMRINTGNGNVGIGTTTPSANLQVVGTTLAAVWSTSDERYKKNIKPVSNAIDKILKLRGVNYDWRQDEFKELKFKSGKDIGFIGQEIEKVLPEVVNKDSKGYLSVNYSNILPVLVEAFKEYKSGNDARVGKLQTLYDNEKVSNEKLSLQLRSVTDENAELKKRLDRMESVLASIERQANEKMAKK